MMRSKMIGLLTVAIMALSVSTASALTINATPSKITVSVSSPANVTLSVTGNITGSYYIKYLINNQNVTASLSGPYLNPSFTSTTPYTTTTPAGTTGSISWTGTNGTTYYFRLTFNAAQPNQTFLTTVVGAAVNFSSYTINITGTTIPGVTTPEICGVLLAAIGLAAIIVVRRRN